MNGKTSGRFMLFLLVLLLSGWRAVPALAAEGATIRLVGLIDRDDQGESIEFPRALFYDYWSSETYLVSSNDRITIYDQKFFPVASFGKGRGLSAPTALAVDRRGNIYVCQSPDNVSLKPRLTIYNQAFFPVREVIFAEIPELADFTALRVAVAESGEIYLSGYVTGAGTLAGVVVLTAEGKFSRILRPPEKNQWREGKKTAPAAGQDGVKDNQAGADPDSGDDSAGLGIELPAGLKPKASSRATEDAKDKGHMEWDTISDVKVDRQGRVYLLSRETSFIYVLDAAGKYLFKFGVKGGAEGKLSNPISLAVDLERRVIYVCDYMRHTILCYEYNDGRFIFEFGGQGVGPLWFNFPNGVEVDQRGRVVVSDLFNRRLQVLDPNLRVRQLSRQSAAALPASPPNEEAAPAVADLPVPPPPEQAALTPPVFLGGPVGVLMPSLPALLAGAALTPPAARAPLLVVAAPPLTSRPQPVRELEPRRLKKVAVPPGPVRERLTAAPLPSPGRPPKPAAVRFSRPPGARPAWAALLDPAEVLARLRAMPAAVGVYGPVAAIFGVAVQLLLTNR